MSSRTVVKAESIEVRTDLDHRVVSFRFFDENDNETDVWLPNGAIFLLRDEIERMLQANPEMETWSPNFRAN